MGGSIVKCQEALDSTIALGGKDTKSENWVSTSSLQNMSRGINAK